MIERPVGIYCCNLESQPRFQTNTATHVLLGPCSWNKSIPNETALAFEFSSLSQSG